MIGVWRRISRVRPPGGGFGGLRPEVRILCVPDNQCHLQCRNVNFLKYAKKSVGLMHLQLLMGMQPNLRDPLLVSCVNEFQIIYDA